MSASDYEKDRLDKLKVMRGIHVDSSNNKDGTQDVPLKKKRKTKGVNPLAAKKKKSKNNGAFGKQTDPTKVCFVLSFSSKVCIFRLFKRGKFYQFLFCSEI